MSRAAAARSVDPPRRAFLMTAGASIAAVVAAAVNAIDALRRALDGCSTAEHGEIIELLRDEIAAP